MRGEREPVGGRGGREGKKGVGTEHEQRTMTYVYGNVMMKLTTSYVNLKIH